MLPTDCLPRVAVRSGDTTAAERRQQRRHPPDILLTTPESVAVLLSQPMARQLFAGLRWVVVDEVHALAASKRGADLALSLERLTELAGGRLQRIGLSATATPLTEAARWLAGDHCLIARAAEETLLQFTLVPLEEGGTFSRQPGRSAHAGSACQSRDAGFHQQPAVGRAARPGRCGGTCRSCGRKSPSTTRRWPPSAAVRSKRVSSKADLRVVVSSTSLELGIDIGAIDLAVLVHPPGDVIRLLQRVGRAGHGPGRVKRGLVLTSTEAELLEATVTAASGQAGQCEPLRIPAHPFDVLCQHILGMAAAQTCSADTMYDLVRRAAPYRNLPRRDFEDCLAYLGCRPASACDPGEERPWLPPRLRGDSASFTLVNQRTARLLRRNLGTILADPVYEVWKSSSVGQRASRRADEESLVENSLIGQVDRAFAERLRPGDRFLLDGRCLQVRSLRPEESRLWVEEVSGRPIVPRWGGEGWPLSTELAQRLYLLRIQAAEALRDGPDELAHLLRRDYALEDAAVATLTAFFQRQECVSEIPDTNELPGGNCRS